MRLLCVQDDEDTRDLLSLVLLERGHEVITATSIAQAIRILSAEEGLVEVVVADSTLPDGDGRSLARHVVQVELPVAVILLARREDRGARDTQPGDGIAAVLPKPVRLASLVAVLERQRAVFAVRKNCALAGEGA